MKTMHCSTLIMFAHGLCYFHCGVTEVTTDRNDRPVAVGSIGNGAGQGWVLGRGLAPSPDYRNKLFCP